VFESICVDRLHHRRDAVELESVECVLHICLLFGRSNIRRHEKLCSAVEIDCGPMQTVGRLISGLKMH